MVTLDISLFLTPRVHSWSRIVSPSFKQKVNLAFLLTSTPTTHSGRWASTTAVLAFAGLPPKPLAYLYLLCSPLLVRLQQVVTPPKLPVASVSLSPKPYSVTLSFSLASCVTTCPVCVSSAALALPAVNLLLWLRRPLFPAPGGHLSLHSFTALGGSGPFAERPSLITPFKIPAPSLFLPITSSRFIFFIPLLSSQRTRYFLCVSQPTWIEASRPLGQGFLFCSWLYS